MKPPRPPTPQSLLAAHLCEAATQAFGRRGSGDDVSVPLWLHPGGTATEQWRSNTRSNGGECAVIHRLLFELFELLELSELSELSSGV